MEGGPPTLEGSREPGARAKGVVCFGSAQRGLEVFSTLPTDSSVVRSEPDTRADSTSRRVRVSCAGIFTRAEEKLVVDPEPPVVGRAVVVMSGGRLAFRRVLEVNGRQLRLRADVAPFEDVWDGDIVGCVRPRLIDRLVALDPERWTRASWIVAVAFAHALAVRRRAKPRIRADLTTKVLTPADWPMVRRFWKEACGDDLPVDAHAHQQVIGLFDGARLVGANIHLVFGKASYSAFTLVHPRYRGIGGGARMIRHAVAVARELELESIYVHIAVRNLASIRAYRGVGFEEKGWWSDEADPMASAERQWKVFELDLTRRSR